MSWRLSAIKTAAAGATFNYLFFVSITFIEKSSVSAINEYPLKLGLSSLGGKLTAFICVTITLGLTLIAGFYALQQERNILLQNERSIQQVLNSVSEGLQTVLMTGSVEVARLYAEKVRGFKDVKDFRVVRTNGQEAFMDNEVINRVNRFRGVDDFLPRATERRHQVIAPEDKNLLQVIKTQRFSYYYTTRQGNEQLTFLLPIKNAATCTRCHSREEQVLGVLEFTTSLDGLKKTIRQSWLHSAIILLASLVAILPITFIVLRHYIIRPLERVSRAMENVSRGDLSQQVPVLGDDELSHIAQNFNGLANELRVSYEGFHAEHNKLETIIMGTEEGIIVANGEGKIVLVNPAAAKLLDKTSDQFDAADFTHLFDEPERMTQLLARANNGDPEPELLLYHQKFLAIYASSFLDKAGVVQGHAAIIRDMTKEKQLEKTLRELSNTDPLTGLANRRSLDDTLRDELSMSLEHGRDLSLLMFDVDHFKKFNDNYGHDQGDRVLKVVATTTRAQGRDILDSVFRYGGEEFMMIARETPQEGGVILAERIRDAIEKMEVDGLKVTVSIGVAGLKETRASTPAELIERADTALYAAKHAGRNCVVAATAGEGS